MVTKYEELASEIIDDVSKVVESQHPELKLHTKYAKESDVLDNPAVIVGIGYYDLESHIADRIKEFVKEIKREKC